MGKLIDEQTAYDVLTAYYHHTTDIQHEALREALGRVETVDAVPVKHGRWETVEDWDGDEHYKCSVCGAEFVLIEGDPDDNDYLFCPHCGARMDGKDSDNE